METCNILQKRGGWWEDLLTNRCIFPIGPRNTFSNIAYVLAGFAAFALRPNLASGVFGLTMVFLGIGSALYHGYKTIWASRLDNAGMYAAFSSLVIYGMAPTHHFIGPVMALGAIISSRLLAYGANWKYLLDPIIGMFVFLSVIANLLRGGYLNAILGFVLFGLAYIVWWMDKKKTLKILPKWGHAIWHVITAVALLILFLGIV